MNKSILALMISGTMLVACKPSQGELAEFSNAVIYPAGTILTMQSEGDMAEAVVVQDNKIIGVGDLAGMKSEFRGAAVDEIFADKVIMPGLIDPHMHVLLAGLMYGQPFAPPWPMAGLDGMRPGYPDPDSFKQRLRDIVAQTPEGTPLIIVYGYHNLVQGDLTRQDLDAISPDIPLAVWHYSGHDFYFNSAGLDFVGAKTEWADKFHGVDLDENGELTGRIYEDAIGATMAGLGPVLFNPQSIARGLDTYFQIVRNAGVTTSADLGYGVLGLANENRTISSMWSKEDDGFRLFLVPEHRAFSAEFGADAPNVVQEMAIGTRPTPAPVLPRVKFFTDAAFYSQTMRLSPPGYLSGQSKGSEGLWVTQPGEMFDTLRPYLEAGLDAHIHSNGDAAQSETLAAVQTARAEGFANDVVIEHGGLFSPDHVRLAGETDTIVSAASHYVNYMSEMYAAPLGEDRAGWISPLGALSEAGVTVTLHSDAPLAPPQPLRAASVQVTRVTREGGTYRAENALKEYDALEAITLDAARALGLSEEFGSIAVGKRADFTILAQNPLEVSAVDWPDIEIWGVVLDGEKRPINQK